MSHIIGNVEKIYDNRLYQGQPSQYPKFVIFVKDQNNVTFELLYYSKDNAPCKLGDKISAKYFFDKKNRPTVEQDRETKVHKFQVIPQTPTQPIPEEIPLDDNLEPDHLANMGVVDNSKTSFNHGDNVKISPNVDKKSIEMFVMAMTKSALESNQLKADSTSIDNFIGDMINIYQNRFI